MHKTDEFWTLTTKFENNKGHKNMNFGTHCLASRGISSAQSV
jgi:hypothetical protein